MQLVNLRNRLSSETDMALENRVMLAASAPARRGVRAGNDGTIDDRRDATKNLPSNQKTTKTGNFEVFDITDDGIDSSDPRNTDRNGNALANRVERRLPKVESADREDFSFEGVFRIDEADSVYFAQLHADDIDPKNPRKSIGRSVHWLLRAEENKDDPDQLDIILERATKKEGRRSNNGRENIFLDSVNKGEQFRLNVEGEHDSRGRIKTDISIDGSSKYSGKQTFTTDFASIRYGAYGAPGGGNAEVLVKDTRYSTS